MSLRNVVLTALLLAAQTQRDSTAPPTGTGVIAGTVFTDEATPRPVRRASVLLASGELKFPQTVVTDDAGRFAFANLAAGNYSLVATKPGYVPATYGSKRPGRGQGVPIAVLDGQKVTDISLKMLHGGVITGTVRSMTGQPVPNLGVQVYQVDSFGGARHLSMAAPGNTATDDRGIYRAFGLAPGDYVVQITVSPMSSGMFGGDSRLVTPAEVQWAAQSGAPGAPGMTGAAALGPAPTPGQTVAYASLYFPGTADTNAASVIILGPEETRAGIDLTMSFVPTARIAGSVLDLDGRPMPGAQISMTPAGGSSDFARLIEGMARSMSRTGADGSFTITGVTPGQYAINARAAARDASGRSQGQGAGALLSVAGLMGMPGSASFWASADLSVNGVDIPDVVLRLQPGMNVSGKIVFEGSSAPPADVTKTSVSLTPPPTGSSQIELVASMMLSGTQATVSADGTFVAKGVAPNKYRVTVTGQGILMGQQLPGSTWTLKSAMFNGRDVSDLPFDLKPNEDAAGMIVTFTDRPTEISGSVVDRAGRPAPGFPIVVFSTDRAYWTIGSRRIQQARPSSDGKYKLSGLPAGEYYVCAVTDLDQNQLYDPSALAALAAGSFKITLADGEKKVQDLKLAAATDVSRLCALLLMTPGMISVIAPKTRPAPPLQAATAVYGYEVVHTYPHDPDAFTQGLIYLDGFLYESTGLNGKSSVRKVKLETGEVLQRRDVDARYFAEGLTEWQGSLIQLTWQTRIGFVYDLVTFAPKRTFGYLGEGWGLTHDATRLIMSDGTSTLRVLDPATLTETGRIAVTDRNQPVTRLNELEFVKGEVYANVWGTDSIVRIAPETGHVTGWINLAGILPAAERTPGADVLNGIAYDASGDRLFVTGKQWPKLFDVRLVPKGS